MERGMDMEPHTRPMEALKPGIGSTTNLKASALQSISRDLHTRVNGNRMNGMEMAIGLTLKAMSTRETTKWERNTELE